MNDIFWKEFRSLKSKSQLKLLWLSIFNKRKSRMIQVSWSIGMTLKDSIERHF